MRSIRCMRLSVFALVWLPACNSAVSDPLPVTPVTPPVTPVADSWTVSGGTAALNMQSAWSRGAVTYVGGATGVYRSDDAGATFRPSNTGNDAVGPTRGFADDATYLYSATSQGVFRSSDAGVTWVARSIGMTEMRTSGIVKAGTRLYVVGPSGVFRSDNQGDSWAAAGLIGVDVRSIAALGDVVFVGTNGSGVMKSVDGGTTWVPSNTGLTAGAFGLGVFYSKTNGDTWAELNTGLGDKTIFDLVISNGFLVAATNTGGAFRISLSALK